MTTFRLSLAPLAYYWSRADTLQFYATAVDWPVDIVYLGEVICSRRHVMKTDDWLALALELRAAGKEVVLSSLTLIDNDADRRAMLRLVERAGAAGLMVEANDFSAVRALQGQAFVAGPHLNVYHADTLAWLQELGALRFAPPLELARDDLAALQAQRSPNMQTEVQVWGRMALAYSARCFTARHHRLRKDNCEFRCGDYPDGLALATRDGAEFLSLNGIQTQSAVCLDLGAALPALAELGVEVLRLQIQSQGMAAVVAAFDLARRSGTAALLVDTLLPPLAARSNGYWHAQAGMRWLSEPTEGACH
ncbi:MULTISPECIES: ubiquinone anaerobic biosynthesis protein UbiV [unclassified Undibacterium]|uniref:ubiquinone anaerobic biosynthesis protein UbiV n=1 Tax=unclassified Undibacterium TaxID=2630295 RepID=UPI002AC8CB1D|nr:MULTISPECIES: U32 family peptidase [unclassified Undibacterium]MEB0138083.1 U32 family peptidase [Undibacterium sp. CCC2.1]MEB0171179.1 U32 family peptidase [Undibacterium sp. CCC1.1]MEB0175224.1 U32 family peptidase [Undibacterium sp. CCC3.4]MEB0214632.1 U32 family peptidase [Undibacterium sp. 5I2]WPX42400.1 U32 family peptidase [Undibacterium sp. CCC3.4]